MTTTLVVVIGSGMGMANDVPGEADALSAFRTFVVLFVNCMVCRVRVVCHYCCTVPSLPLYILLVGVLVVFPRMTHRDILIIFMISVHGVCDAVSVGCFHFHHPPSFLYTLLFSLLDIYMDIVVTLIGRA